MKPLTIADASVIALGLQDEIRRSRESRYDHRLHGVLLVAQGMSCPEVSRLLGDSPRTVEYWVRRFEEQGLAGLVEGERVGRPRRLSEKQLEEINAVLRQPPESVGIPRGLWDGKGLSAFIKQRYGVTFGVRQCQYMFKSFAFRLRKPRPLIARADPEVQERYKKTSKARGRSKNRSLGDR
jgi:transposase